MIEAIAPAITVEAMKTNAADWTKRDMGHS
jgi:hypothetical protein